jgi:hypothetical protein
MARVLYFHICGHFGELEIESFPVPPFQGMHLSKECERCHKRPVRLLEILDGEIKWKDSRVYILYEMPIMILKIGSVVENRGYYSRIPKRDWVFWDLEKYVGKQIIAIVWRMGSNVDFRSCRVRLSKHDVGGRLFLPESLPMRPLDTWHLEKEEFIRISLLLDETMLE